MLLHRIKEMKMMKSPYFDVLDTSLAKSPMSYIINDRQRVRKQLHCSPVNKSESFQGDKATISVYHIW